MAAIADECGQSFTVAKTGLSSSETIIASFPEREGQAASCLEEDGAAAEKGGENIWHNQVRHRRGLVSLQSGGPAGVTEALEAPAAG